MKWINQKNIVIVVLLALVLATFVVVYYYFSYIPQEASPLKEQEQVDVCTPPKNAPPTWEAPYTCLNR